MLSQYGIAFHRVAKCFEQLGSHGTGRQFLKSSLDFDIEAFLSKKIVGDPPG